MPKDNGPLCILALEEKPNSFIPINISDLGIETEYTSYGTLKEIDNIVLNYGEDYIKEVLRKSNIVDENCLKGNLVIILGSIYSKRKLPLITKEISERYNLDQIMLSNCSNKEFTNQIINKMKNLKIDDTVKYNMISILRSGNANLFLIYYETLSYLAQREIYFIIINILIKLEEKNVIIRERKETE